VQLLLQHSGELGVNFAGEGEVIAVNGPAFKAGMQPGDCILSVDGIRSQGMNHDEISQMMQAASMQDATPCIIVVSRYRAQSEHMVDLDREQCVRTGTLHKLSSKQLWQARNFFLDSFGQLKYFNASGTQLGGVLDTSKCYGIFAVGRTITINMNEAGDDNVKLRASTAALAIAWAEDIHAVSLENGRKVSHSEAIRKMVALRCALLRGVPASQKLNISPRSDTASLMFVCSPRGGAQPRSSNRRASSSTHTHIH
jgi:hypothetical protein